MEWRKHQVLGQLGGGQHQLTITQTGIRRRITEIGISRALSNGGTQSQASIWDRNIKDWEMISVGQKAFLGI